MRYWGFPQNLGDVNDTWNSLLGKMVAEVSSGVFEGVDGRVLSGLESVTEGHRHADTAQRVLTWMQLGTFNPSNASVTVAPAGITNHGAEVASTGSRRIALLPLTVPLGVDTVKLFARVNVDGANGLTVNVNVYSFDNLSLALDSLSFTELTARTNAWIEIATILHPTFDISGATVASNGTREVYFDVFADNASSATPENYIFELMVAFL